MSGTSNLTAQTKFDVVALGELLIDFTESGLSANGQRLFEQNPGGAPANMLTAATRFGLSTALIGKVGNDMHGQFLKSTLDAVGVNTAGLIIDDSVFTTLAFVALQNGERAFSFARKPGADTCLRSEEVDKAILGDTKVFHIGSLSLTDEPARAATLEALVFAKEHGVVVSYDPNYRASLWPSAELAAQQMRSVLPFADLIKISDEETALLTGIEDPEQAAKFLLAQGAACVAVTLGKQGALVCVGGDCTVVEGYDIPATDTTGAGDAFWGGFVSQFVRAQKPLRTLQLADAARFAKFGNAAATLCVTRRGGIPAMPTIAEVQKLMVEYSE